MPFRDPVTFLILPPGATPPQVGVPAIELNPNVPGFGPVIFFYSGDADEATPGFIYSDVIDASGRMYISVVGHEHTPAGDSAYLNLISGSDATPNNTRAELGGDTIELQVSSWNATFDSLTDTIDFDGAFTLSGLGTSPILRIAGPIESSAQLEAFANKPVPARVGQDVDTASSAAIGAVETIVQTVTVALVSGGVYRITADIGVAVLTVADVFIGRIREDNAAGTVLQGRRPIHPTTGSPYPFHIEGEYTASATGNKTFVLTLLRTAGASTIVMAASATQPSYFYVDYIRGLTI